MQFPSLGCEFPGPWCQVRIATQVGFSVDDIVPVRGTVNPTTSGTSTGVTNPCEREVDVAYTSGWNAGDNTTALPSRGAAAAKAP